MCTLCVGSSRCFRCFAVSFYTHVKRTNRYFRLLPPYSTCFPSRRTHPLTSGSISFMSLSLDGIPHLAPCASILIVFSSMLDEKILITLLFFAFSPQNRSEEKKGLDVHVNSRDVIRRFIMKQQIVNPRSPPHAGRICLVSYSFSRCADGPFRDQDDEES